MPDGQFPSLSPTAFPFMNPQMPVGPHTGFEGFPFSDNILGSVIYSQLARHMQSSNMMPINLNQQNLFDQARNAQFMQMHNELLREAARRDAENVTRTVQGLHRAAGIRFDAGQREATLDVARQIGMLAAPLAVMDPAGAQAAEMFGGIRGLETVMMHRLLMGGRFRADPITGAIGMSRESMRAMLTEFGNLVSRDDVTALQGFTAGQLGSMAQFLQSRGLAPTLRGPGAMRAALAQLEGAPAEAGEDFLSRAMDRTAIGAGRRVAELTREELDRLTRDPEVGTRLRRIDAQRIAQRSQEYLEAIRAMGDLLGRPTDPIPELAAALEQFVGPTAMAQLSPQRIAQMVRRTREMARLTGVPAEVAMGLSRHMAGELQRVGIDPGPFVQPFTEQVLAFRHAFGEMGFQPAFGRMTTEQATALAARRLANAAGSEAANNLAAFMRIREVMGGRFDDPEAERIARMVDLHVMDRPLTRREMGQILGRVGVSESQVAQFISQRGANLEFAGRFDIPQQVMMRMQPDTIKDRAGLVAASFLARNLQLANIPQDKLLTMGQRTVQRMVSMTDDEVTNMSSRNKIMQDTINEELTRMGIAEDAPVREQVTARLADLLVGRFGQDPHLQQMGIQNAQRLYQITNPEAIEQQRRTMTQGRIRAQIAGGLQGLGRGTLMQRVIRAVQESPTGSIADIAKAIFGGNVGKDDVLIALAPSLRAMHTRAGTLEDLQQQLVSETDPERQEQLRRAIQAQTEAAQEEAARFMKAAEPFGGMTGLEKLRKETISKEKKKTDEMQDKQDELGEEVIGDTTEQVDATKGKPERGAVTVTLQAPDEIRITSGELQITGNVARLAAKGGYQDVDLGPD